jgi:NitT/TauT family transport system substrate-binding protein
VRIVAGATSGGAALVVRDGIDVPADLAGARLASPALGNTQDVALRAWLADQGFAVDAQGAGDVSVLPQANGDTLTAFVTGQIDGAWVPEPWAYRLQQAGGEVLVNEDDLWPGKKFVTTHVVVRTEFLEQHPDVVKKFLEGHVEATETVNADPAAAQRAVSEGIGRITGKPLKVEIVAGGWRTLDFTVDPVASSLIEGARHAVDVELLEPVDDLEGIYDLDPLNEVLGAKSLEQVSGP